MVSLASENHVRGAHVRCVRFEDLLSTLTIHIVKGCQKVSFVMKLIDFCVLLGTGGALAYKSPPATFLDPPSDAVDFVDP